MDGIAGFLQDALNTWNNKIAEVWELLSQSPQSFKGGGVWNVIANVHDGLKAIGYALLVLFFLFGVVKTCSSVAELKRPEVAVKILVRFVLAQAAITYGMDLLLALMGICQGVISTIAGTSGGAIGGTLTLPTEIIEAIDNVGFLASIPLWIVSFVASLLVTVLSFVVLLTVYNRFFKLYFHAAIAPIPLAAFAGEPSSAMGKAFIKSFAAVCLEGAIVMIACIVFSALAASPPALTNGEAVNMVWSYVGELIFNLLVLVGAVRLADQTVKGMLGL